MIRGKETDATVLEPVLDDERVERLWSGIARSRRRTRLRNRTFGAAGVLCLIVGGAALVRHATAPQPREIVAEPNAFRLRNEDGAEVLELGDGSVLQARSGTRFTVERADASNVRVSLETGILDVAARATSLRVFSIMTPYGRLETRDGRFDVEVAGPRLVVRVATGLVDVYRDGLPPEHLRDGAHWGTGTPSAPSPVAVLVSARPPEPSPLVPVRGKADAARLLEQADAARLANDAAGAARLLDDLRTRFPTDPNAGLAAFEAGRIHLRRAEPARAVDAFRFAVAHADDAFLEDAEAGLAQALSEAGDAAGCTAARARYLEHYPLGAHRARVGALCR